MLKDRALVFSLIASLCLIAGSAVTNYENHEELRRVKEVADLVNGFLEKNQRLESVSALDFQKFESQYSQLTGKKVASLNAIASTTKEPVEVQFESMPIPATVHSEKPPFGPASMEKGRNSNSKANKIEDTIKSIIKRIDALESVAEDRSQLKKTIATLVQWVDALKDALKKVESQNTSGQTIARRIDLLERSMEAQKQILEVINKGQDRLWNWILVSFLAPLLVHICNRLIGPSVDTYGNQINRHINGE